jgi:hypothetical protein
MHVMDPRQVLELAPDVVLQVVGGEALLLKLHDETVFSLNQTAARIAQEVAYGRSLDAVADTLAREFGVDRDEVLRDATEIVETWLARGLVMPRHRGAGAP